MPPGARGFDFYGSQCHYPAQITELDVKPLGFGIYLAPRRLGFLFQFPMQIGVLINMLCYMTPCCIRYEMETLKRCHRCGLKLEFCPCTGIKDTKASPKSWECASIALIKTLELAMEAALKSYKKLGG